MDQITMSGRWFVDRISGGNIVWSWSKSTSNFQSEAPCSSDLVGVDDDFLKLLRILAPALTKQMRGVVTLFVEFQESKCDCKASWMCRRTESCLQVYLFVQRATGQSKRIWCSVHWLFEHRWHRLELEIPQRAWSFYPIDGGIENKLYNAVVWAPNKVFPRKIKGKCIFWPLQPDSLLF